MTNIREAEEILHKVDGQKWVGARKNYQGGLSQKGVDQILKRGL